MSTTAFGAAAQWIEKEYGGKFAVDKGSVTVGTTAKKVVDNNPDAVALLFLNLGGNTAYADLDNNPSSIEGILINANGGGLSMDVRSDLLMPSYEWWMVSPAGNTTIYYIRVRRYSNQ